MTDNQIEIIKKQLIPMIVKDVMPLMQMVLEKRLNLFADEIIKSRIDIDRVEDDEDKA